MDVPTGKMTSNRILLFGDLSYSFEEELKVLLHVHDNALLTSFFEQVGAKIRYEIGQLSTELQFLFPRFTTLIDLVSKLGETGGTSILQFCLLPVCQIGQFLNYFGRSGRLYPTTQETSCLGICAGSFAAAAVSVARSLPDLVQPATTAVAVAFRTALTSFIARIDITSNHVQHDGCWAAVVAGEEHDLERELEAFTASENIQPAWRLYVSATTPTHVTLSGPPQVLSHFLSTHQVKFHELQIQSPFHAPHIFHDPFLVSISDSDEENVDFHTPYFALRSPSSGAIVKAESFTSLLTQIARGCLSEKVNWSLILDRVIADCLQDKIESCEILAIGSNAAQLLSNTLQQAKIETHVERPLSTPERNLQQGRFSDSSIAIIGYSGRFPDAGSNEEFWDLLRAGKDVHREIPADRFNWKTHYDSTGKTKNTSRIKYGCFIKEPGVFDARFFNISPREAENTDPAQRLAITTVYEAMEMAGMVTNRTPSTQQDRVGVFFGTTSDDWREVNSGQDVDTYFIPGGNRAFVPGRISYFFRFSGPSLSMDTACSSSFAAIQTACAYLWRGECDTAIAGGTNVLTNPDNFVGLDRGHFLSTTGNCNTFDDGASGYCRADAVGSVILKRLEDAEMDNDPIFGIISGATTNHCGQTDSITRPHEGDQTSVFSRIIRHAGINPLDVSYVEMHGTGTQAGDATEMNSVLSVFVPERKRMPRHPLYLGSAKANIGHAESASGVASLIKVLMMMKFSEIPPHCGIKTIINHNYPLDLKERNVNIAFESKPWRREDMVSGKRYAFLNNFSAAGGNTAVLLEDAPKRPMAEQKDPRSFHLVTVSSKTAKALSGNIESLIKCLEAASDIELSSLSYTTTSRRMQHNYRIAIVSNSIASTLEALRSKMTLLEPKTIPPAIKLPKVVFTFTGQGACYAGLGQELFFHVGSFRQDIVRFDRMCIQQGFPSFINVVQNPDSKEITDPIVAQLATTCVQMALAKLWKSWGIKPSFAIGHSLGEYAALFTSGALSASDAIFLVGSRAQLLVRHCKPETHSMLAIKAPLDSVQSIMQGSLAEIACVNQPTSIVVSGKLDEIDRLRDIFQSAGHNTTQLDIPFAFHSSQVEPILEQFEIISRSVRYQPLTTPYISPLSSEVIPEGQVIEPDYLVKSCRQAVNFQGALEAATKAGLLNEKNIWLDIGAHPLCSGMVKGTLGSASKTAATLRKDTNTWKVLNTTFELLYLNGIEIDWNEYHRDFTAYNRVVELPRYSWDFKNYWIMYRNDFCLTKGEGMEPLKAPSIEVPKSSKYLSPSLQRVVEESHSDKTSSILVESDVHDPRLCPIFSGHKVNGTEMCPSSLYADVGFHITTYLMEQRSLPTENIGMNICRMRIDKPLLSNPSLSSQLFRISAEALWSDNSVKISIYSINDKGVKTLTHVNCVVQITAARTWGNDWKRNAYLILSRIKQLRQSVEHGDAHRLKRRLVYRLFANIVEYSPDYQGMDEVVMDTSELEAVSTVRFQVDERGFYFNPQWIDSLGGVAGFIMNGNESPHPQAEVFINHGWDEFKMISTFEVGKSYHAYNRMQLVEGTLYAGDTYIFDGDKIVALIEGIKFLGVPRRVLDGLRPPGNSSQSKPAQQKPETKPNTRTEAKSRSTREPPPLPSPNGGIWLSMLAILAEEVGVGVGELKPEIEFVELGLDSLLSLTITGRFSDELNLDLPSSVFVDCPTVKEFQQAHGQEASPLSSPAGTETSSVVGAHTGTSTPETSFGSDDDEPLDFVHTLKSTISEETGTKMEELLPSSRLDELGVDSLLALTMMGRLSELFETELPSSLFADNETLAEVEAAVASVLGISLKPAQSTVLEGGKVEDSVVRNAPHATSILLQGPANSAKSAIFLFPDGSGSASSYASMARIDPKVAVWGLNCPWRTSPEEMARSGCDLIQLSAKYLMEMRRRQPKGPYSVGGWSAGGICAFEAARQLVEAGEVVEHLLLIDSPNPIGLQNPPARMYDFFQELGIFGSGQKVPQWLRLHFDAFISMLDNYKATPWSDSLGKAPETLIVYAKDGVCKDPKGPRPEIRPDDPREMIWLLNNRTDFSADGWASLIGRDRVSIEVLEEVNHFSMMDKGPQMDKMGKYIRKALV